jgi:sec-independent protein translocase protein TatC
MALLRNVLALSDPDPKEMSIVDHLDELRGRLIICILVVSVGSVIGWFFVRPAFDLLSWPLSPYLASHSHPLGAEFVLSKITDPFTLKLKIAVIIGIALGFPILLYETWMFVAPAISVQSRRYTVPFVLLGILLFLVGGYVGYLLFPRVVGFLVAQQSSLSGTRLLLNVSDYVSQFALVLVIFGGVFEIPVVITLLARIGVISSHFLRRKRKHAAMIGLIVAMIITPGADPLTPFVTAAVIYALFEVSIILVRLTHR